MEIEKKQLRRRMRALRLVADQKQGPDAALGLVHTFLPRVEDVGLRPGQVIAGYWPIITEIDIRPLLARLIDRGFGCCLPAIVSEGDGLEFRRWHTTDVLEPGARETMHLPVSAPVVRPDVLFVPLLAFDGGGHRLGQGGGYYDRTLAALRRDGRPIAIGVGYAAQRLEHVPNGPNDARMDWLLTEHDLKRAVV